MSLLNIGPVGRGGLIAASLLLAGLAWWAVSSTDAGDVSSAPLAEATRSASAGAALASTSAASLPAASQSDPLLTRELPHTLEALLLAAQQESAAASPEQLKQRLDQLADQHFPPDQRTRAKQLLHRYVDYRVALGTLAPPTNLNDASALRASIAQRRQLRERHFSPEEYAALFEQSETLDRQALAALDIQAQTQLSPAQKQTALAAVEQQFSPQERAERSASQSHLAVAAHTAQFDAQGTSEQARYAERSRVYGADAALRLGQLDAQERDWQARLSQYASESAKQQASANGEAANTALKERLFTPEERLRLAGALEARALAASK